MATKKTATKRPAPAQKPAAKKTVIAVAPAAVKRGKPAVVGRQLVRVLRRPAIIVVLLIALVGAAQWATAATGDSATQPVSQDGYQQQLQAQVEQPDGSPNTGRDPATQGQNSLAAAASKPAGAGLRTDQPASTSDTTSHTGHDTQSDSESNGIGTNGCYIDYGIQGEQCLPAHAAGADKILSCAEVRKYFKDGIKVTGTDRFHLDHNGDKIACGPGEESH